MYLEGKQARPAFTGFMCMFVLYSNSLKFIQYFRLRLIGHSFKGVL